MSSKPLDQVQIIPIDRINVLNPRERNKRKFRDLVDSISHVGLKKPITVSRRTDKNEVEHFDLVCGQGRLEAYMMLDQTRIPCIVTDLSKEDCLLMSLVENLARRQHTSMELMRDFLTLSERGYEASEIASKTGLSLQYVKDILYLLHNGEERLIASVERGQIPITVAVEITNTGDEDIQQALTAAYERNELRGNRLQVARRIIQQRQLRGKGLSLSAYYPNVRKPTAQYMVRVYKQETARHKAMIMKGDLTERRLLFIISALKELFNDENFVTLLRAEGLDTVPRQIADILQGRERAK